MTAKAIIATYDARKDGNLYFGTAESEGLLTDTREPVDYEETNSLGPNAAGAILDAMDMLISSVE